MRPAGVPDAPAARRLRQHGRGHRHVDKHGNAATDAETGEETKATLDLPEKRFDDFELTFITRDEAEWSTVEIIPTRLPISST